MTFSRKFKMWKAIEVLKIIIFLQVLFNKGKVDCSCALGKPCFFAQFYNFFHCFSEVRNLCFCEKDTIIVWSSLKIYPSCAQNIKRKALTKQKKSFHFFKKIKSILFMRIVYYFCSIRDTIKRHFHYYS